MEVARLVHPLTSITSITLLFPSVSPCLRGDPLSAARALARILEVLHNIRCNVSRRWRTARTTSIPSTEGCSTGSFHFSTFQPLFGATNDSLHHARWPYDRPDRERKPRTWSNAFWIAFIWRHPAHVSARLAAAARPGTMGRASRLRLPRTKLLLSGGGHHAQRVAGLCSPSPPGRPVPSHSSPRLPAGPGWHAGFRYSRAFSGGPPSSSQAAESRINLFLPGIAARMGFAVLASAWSRSRSTSSASMVAESRSFTSRSASL
jgi:hypothetical protein